MKKRKILPVIQIEDSHGTILFSGESIDLIFPEALILKMSMNFFSDPAPCFILRSAVIIRLQEEICQLFTQTQELTKCISVSDLNEEYREYFGAYPDAMYVRLEEKGNL